jgi:hypothetical protein
MKSSRVFLRFQTWALLFSLATALPGAAATLVWTNMAGGDWSTAVNWSPNQVPGPMDEAAITNTGTYTVTSSAGATAGTVTMSAPSGAQTLNLAGGAFFLAGAFNGNAQSVLALNGGDADWTGGSGATVGALILNQGTLLGTTPVTVLNLGGFSWTNSDEGTIEDVLYVNGGVVDNAWGLNGGQLINNGILTWVPYPYTGGGSVISNSSKGTLNLVLTNAQQYIVNNHFGGTATFYNAGQMNVIGPSSGTLANTFINTGTVNVESGTLDLSDGGTNFGTITVASNAVLQVSGGTFYCDAGSTITGAGTNMVSGGTADFGGVYTVDHVVVSGGVANWSAASNAVVDTLTINGGTLEGSTPLFVQNPGGFAWGPEGGTVDDVLYVNGGVVDSPGHLDGGRLINYGALNWISYPDVTDGAVISNATGGTITLVMNGRPFDGNHGGTIAFDNAGQFIASGSAAFTSDRFTNTGVFTINSGIFQFNGSWNLTNGTLSFGISNLNTFGAISLLGPANLAGTISAAFNGGFFPAVGDSWQVLTYTSSSGGFASTNLPPVAVWQVNQGSTALSITVLKLVPQMVWAAPAAITYGAALTSAQLDAQAVWNGSPVPGTLVYNPPLNTLLGPGSNQVLSVTFTPSDTATYASATATALINVQRAPLSVTAASAAKTYGQTLDFAGTEFSASGLVNGDVVTRATLSSAGAASNAPLSGSPYAVTITNALGNAGLTNYIITYAIGALTVDPAPLAVTASGQAKTYGQTLVFGSGSTQFTSTNLQNGETIGSVTLAVSGNGGAPAAPANTYTITPSAATGGTFNPSNYQISYYPGTLSVSKAPLIITADNVGKVFGQTLAFAGTEFTASGLQNSETIGSVTLTSAGATASAAVGAYSVVPSAPTGGTFANDNYTSALANGILTVVGPPELVLTLSGPNYVLTFSTLPNESYQVQSATNLLSGDWSAVGGPIGGTGGSISLTNALSSAPTFYRLEITF